MSPEQLKQALADLLTRWSKESDVYAEAAERAEDNNCASHEKAAEVYGDVHDELKVIIDKANLGLTTEQLRRIRDMMIQKRLELEQKFGPFPRFAAPEEEDHSADWVSDEDVDAIIAANRERDLKEAGQ